MAQEAINPIQTGDIDRYAHIIWDYMHLNQPLEPCDVILALGSSDLRVAERAAQLFTTGYGKQLVVSGGFGRITKDRFAAAEADIFADIVVRMGVPADKLLLERQATNTGENITLTHALLTQSNVQPKSILVVTKPYMERRTYATFKKQWPAPATKLFVTSPDVSYYSYFTPDLPKDLVINTMVGDLQRIREYPKRGYQIPQDIPANVWDAYEKLVAAGFNKALIHD